MMGSRQFWFRLNDNYFEDVDIIEIGWPAAGLWPLILSLVRGHGEDGFLSRKYWRPSVLARFACWTGGEKDIERAMAGFIQTGLILEHEDEVEVRSWSKYQTDPTANERQKRHRSNAVSRPVTVTERDEALCHAHTDIHTDKQTERQTPAPARASSSTLTGDTLPPQAQANLEALKAEWQEYAQDTIAARELAMKLAAKFPGRDTASLVRRMGEKDGCNTKRCAPHKVGAYLYGCCEREQWDGPKPGAAATPERAPSKLDTLEARIAANRTFTSEDVWQAAHEARRDGMGLARWPSIETAERKLRAKGWITDADWTARNVRLRELDDMEAAPERCGPPENMRSLLSFARAVPEEGQ